MGHLAFKGNTDFQNKHFLVFLQQLCIFRKWINLLITHNPQHPRVEIRKVVPASFVNCFMNDLNFLSIMHCIFASNSDLEWNSMEQNGKWSQYLPIPLLFNRSFVLRVTSTQMLGFLPNLQMSFPPFESATHCCLQLLNLPIKKISSLPFLQMSSWPWYYLHCSFRRRKTIWPLSGFLHFKQDTVNSQENKAPQETPWYLTVIIIIFRASSLMVGSHDAPLKWRSPEQAVSLISTVP